MSSVVFEQVYRKYLPDLELALRSYVPSAEGLVSQLYGIICYHLGWTDEQFNPVNSGSGKRLRPTLCLASCQAAGGDYHSALPAAAALELLHNYSLIHDDIEDRSDQRRHRPTVWSIWGEALAINAGDALFALARMAMLDLPRAGTSLTVAAEACRIFDRTSLKLCEGQHMDMAFETRLRVTSDEYMKMIGGKTAALMAASAEIGALIAGREEDHSRRYHEFGRLLGIAFQIQDDILGIWGKASITGKAASDIYQRKKTLPIVYAMDKASDKDQARLLNLYQQPVVTDEEVNQILDILARTSAQEFAEAEAWRHYNSAINLLDSDGFRGDCVNQLRAIADFLVDRRS